jgi:ribosomal peptide maturation radical SAM protein 1
MPRSVKVQCDEIVDVLLVNMPFAALFRPSIGLSLLKAGLQRVKISSRILYFTTQFAEQIGTSLYIRIANQEPRPSDLAGDWIFSEALFGKDCVNSNGFIEQILQKRNVDQSFIDNLIQTRLKVESFLEQCLNDVLSYSPKIVGFTSVFHQHIASLALAKRIKEKSPGISIVLGGTNCEGVMGAETSRQFPFIDAVVSGEGDLVFPELAQRILEGKPFDDLRGVYTWANTGSLPSNHRYVNAVSVRDMDSLPVADYDDYFEQLNESNLDAYYQPRILFESSRGCWWGERSHCTFCGLNGETLAYRSKSQTRVLEELIHLKNKYPNLPISAVDNILDMKYFKQLVPELAARQMNLEIFYEVKANLKKEQVRLLREAGITSVQPGVESFSTRVLQLMGKGIRGLQNIQLLKWCKEFGIQPSWNILWGFPGEPSEEYARMAALIPLLAHLPPPESNGKIRLDRFSPNFEYAEKFGFANVEPYPAYQYVYPFHSKILSNIAYYFTYDYREPQDVESYTSSVAEQINIWQEAYETSDLFSVDLENDLLIWDLRLQSNHPLTVLNGIQKVLYVSCDRIRTQNELEQLLNQNEGACAKDVEALLQPLLDRGLILKDGNSYLSLAIPLGNYSLSQAVLQKFNELIHKLGQESKNELIISFDRIHIAA